MTTVWTTIPGFTKYEIDRDGVVRRKSDQTLLDCNSFRPDKNSDYIIESYHISADKGIRMSVEKRHLLDATYAPDQLTGVTPLFLSIVQSQDEVKAGE